MNDTVPEWVKLDRHPGGVPTPASVFQHRHAPNDPEPVVPKADGKLVINGTDGNTHEYPYALMPKGWRPREEYLSVSVAHGWTHWPWGSILNFETHVNSDEFVVAKEAHQAWRRRHQPTREEETTECQS